MLATPAFAQDAAPVTADVAPAAPATAETVAGDEIVVTAVARRQDRLDSSVSVSSLNADAIAASAPRSAAELFRSLPGIHSESSDGEGNANIQSRGIPISTGGAKFLQLRDPADGGEVLLFAGGVINTISKTGAVKGGSIVGTLGVDYGEYRLDANYGGRLSGSLTFNVGGFYRLNVKYLDDRAIAYLPNPVRVTRSNSNPDYQALPGLSPNNDTIHSIYFTQALTLHGSLRYDFGRARGFVLGDGPVVPTDVNGDSVISVTEAKTAMMPLNATRPVITTTAICPTWAA